jgi:hypothetical protein
MEMFQGEDGLLVCGCFGRRLRVFPKEKMKLLPKTPKATELIPGRMRALSRTGAGPAKAANPPAQKHIMKEFDVSSRRHRLPPITSTFKRKIS